MSREEVFVGRERLGTVGLVASDEGKSLLLTHIVCKGASKHDHCKVKMGPGSF